MEEQVEGKNTYSIQIDIINASNEYRAVLYRLLNDLHFENPNVFNYHTLGLDEGENNTQINDNNE